METKRINRRIRFIVRWSPLLFIFAAVWAFLSWRDHFVSVPYFLACVAIGLFCGVLIIADYRNNWSPLVNVLSYLIFISAPAILNGFVFTNLEPKGPMGQSYQYTPVVLASVLGLIVTLRQKITRHIAERDAEQALAADSVEQRGY